MQNKKIKIVVMILIFLITILLGVVYVKSAKYNEYFKSLDELMETSAKKNITISYAAEIGEGSYGGKKNVARLWRNQNLYCVQQDYTMMTNHYWIVRHIKLKGNKATVIEDGNIEGKSSIDNMNLKLAYILAGGNYAYGYGEDDGVKANARQKAIWYWLDNWTNTMDETYGFKIGYEYFKNPKQKEWDASGAKGKKVLSDADTYVKNHINASIRSDGEKIISKSNTISGPINIEYTGNIDSIIVKDIEDSIIPNNQISFYSDIEAKNVISNISNIKSKEEFYIKNTSGKILKDITVNVKSDDILCAEIWFLGNTQPIYQEGDNRITQRMIAVKPSKQPDVATLTMEILPPQGKIVINKKDENTNAKLSAEFKILTSEGWLSNKNNIYKYDDTIENASIYSTGKNGQVIIDGLDYGTYTIFETKAPGNYDIKAQENYNSENNAVRIGEVTINSDNNNADITVSNKKVISISGFVWEDTPAGKNNVMNSIYDNTETKIPEVTVYLKDRREIDNSKYVQRVTTDENGNYILNNVLVNNLSNYYIEFDYSTVENGKYKRYIPVTFNVNDSNIENTSKALKSDLVNGAYPVKDSELTGKATTYKGTPKGTNAQSLYGLQEGGTLFNKLYNQNTYTLQHINLGIQPVKDTEYRIEQDISYAKINYKGFSHKYIYGGVGDITLEDTPIVNWQSGKTYSRDIYPSDIAGNIKDPNSLKVYVVYRIMIKNTVKYNVPDIYSEKQLIIKNLTESIDSKYELSTDIDEKLDDNVVKNDIGKWTATSATATYKDEDNDGKLFEIKSGEQQSIYIQFRVKNNEINKIMQNDATALVTANTIGYHEYTRNDNGWFNDSIKKQGNHETEDKQASAEAPGMRFRLPGDTERVIKGIVFKDNVTEEKKTTNEIVGNGKYDSDENTVEKVTVQLYDKDGKTVVARYPKNSKTTTLETTEPVVTTVGGKYSLLGVTPGEYIIRFTYGDGTTYDVKDYKSTVVTLESAKNAFKKQNNTHGNEWYKYKNNGNELIDEYNYSIAIDDLETRQKINKGEDIKLIDSNTPISAITIENTPINITKAEDGIKPDFDGFNLGIIEQVKQTAQLEKIITNVKLTNAMNNVIFDGNPQNADMKGVTDLDGNDTNNGSTYTKIEMDSNLIYGSTLELTYDISIKDKNKTTYYCEIDEEHYGWYYMYGEIGDYSRKVLTNAEEVLDYLDPSLVYQSYKGSDSTVKIEELNLSVSNDWRDASGNVHNINSAVNNRQTDLKNNRKISHRYTKVLDIKGLLGNDKKATIIATRRLSTQDDDMEILNAVQITKIGNDIEKKTGDPDNLSENENVKKSIELIKSPELPEPAEAKATITPPTGENRQLITIYIIAGISSLIVMAAGIVLIKKKIA